MAKCIGYGFLALILLIGMYVFISPKQEASSTISPTATPSINDYIRINPDSLCDHPRRTAESMAEYLPEFTEWHVVHMTQEKGTCQDGFRPYPDSP